MSAFLCRLLLFDQLDNISTSTGIFQIREPGRELLQRECVGGRCGSRKETEEKEDGCGGQQQGGDHVDDDEGEMAMKQWRREGGEPGKMFSFSF